MCGGADHYGVGLGACLKPSGKVRRFAEGQLLVPGAAPDLAHYDEPRVNTHPNRKSGVALPPEADVQTLHCVSDTERRSHGTRGIVLVGAGIAEVDEQPVTEILRDVALEAVDDLGTRLLVGAHRLAHVLGVQLPRKRRRTYEITEHHRQLTAFGFGGNTKRCLRPAESASRVGSLNGFD